MANYKIKDLQQASSLNRAIAFEIQDGNNKSTFATLDQIAEFLGNDTPVVLRVKRSGEGGYLPDMTIAEITASYAKIVADPVHNIPVVSIPDAGGQYLLPSGYNTNVGLNSILGHYYSQNYVQPYVLELTNSTFKFGRNGGNKDVKIGELAVSSGVPIAYMDIADGDTSENISDIVGGPVSFHETCNALKLSTIAAGFRFSNGVKTVYIPIATDVSISGDVYTLSMEYEKEAVVTRLQVREQNGVFSASRTDYSIPDLETDFTEQLSRLEIALRANGSDLVYSSQRVVIEASESRSNYVEVPIGAVAVDDKLSLSLGLIKITSGAPSGFSFALVDAAGTSIANVLMLQGQLTGTFTVRTTASDARLRLFAGKDGSTAGVGVEYGTVMLVRGDIPASALSLLDVLDRSKEYTDDIAAAKADLDPATGCVPSAQIAPLQGKQTGVQMGEGRFLSADPALLIDGDRTIAALFYPDLTDAGQQIVYADHLSHLINPGISIQTISSVVRVGFGKVIGQVPIKPDTLYLVVVSVKKDEIATVYINSSDIGSNTDHSGITSPEIFTLGSLSHGILPFKGRIIGLRLFNYALSASEAAALWNGGEPERYMLPLSGEMRTGLVAEYIAAGLLADKWRDTSGAGLDLPYLSTVAGQPAELDYQQPPATPSGSPLHDLFVAAGAVWNGTTKRWKYSLLSDISTDEMLQMYTYIGVSGGDISGAYANFKARTNFIPLNRDTADFNNSNRLLLNNTFIEVFNSAKTYATLYNVQAMFRGASNLRTITGVLVMTNITSTYDMFTGCTSLSDVYILKLKCDISLSDSPLITAARVKFIVDNAANTAAITVTVHADVYAKLTDPSNTDWYSINAAAQAKNISFATA